MTNRRTVHDPIALRLAGRADERDHAHRPDGPDKAVPPTVDVVGSGGWVSAGLCGQAARAGAGSGRGSGSGMGGCGRAEGAPGQLAGVWSSWLGWLNGPLSQYPLAGLDQVLARV